MYAKIKNQQVIQFPYSLGSFRSENPGTSFPASIPDSTLAEFDVYPVTSTPAPAFNPQTHRLISHPEFIGNVWTQVWQAEQLSVEKATNNIRAERNRRLTACDWTQLPDASVDVTTWSTYRQELRDIPTQTGFPWNVQWPVKPSLLDEQPAVDGSDNIDAGDGSNTISTGDGSNTISTGDGEDTISVIV